MALLGYLLGSLSFAILVSRLRGLADPRSYGSKNPGATNMLRSGDKRAAALTLLGDALKGLVAVLLASQASQAAQLDAQSSQWVLASVALATFLGHLFPIYFGFRGGKGVATALGILL
ncbi:MAG: glycerol-3-phosphate acyltransferase, partial [Betaproteobacteria bacterium]|nr:glycerol-3-phosphate acyltransferase [Betaproteobacteria bacterium]